jgi:hypothetical protein
LSRANRERCLLSSTTELTHNLTTLTLFTKTNTPAPMLLTPNQTMNQPIQGQHRTSSYPRMLVNTLNSKLTVEALLTTVGQTLLGARSSNTLREQDKVLTTRKRNLHSGETRSMRRNHSISRDTCRILCLLKCNRTASQQLRLWTDEVVHSQLALYALKQVSVDRTTTMLAPVMGNSSTKEASKTTKASERQEGLAATKDSWTQSLSREVVQHQARAKSTFRISIS